MARFIILFFIILSSVAFADSKTIILAADPWCPWNCDDENKPGIAVEMAKAIYEPLGYKVQYVSISWSRAIDEAVKGHVTGLIGADRSIPEIKDFIFPKAAISHFDDVYVLKADSNFVYKGLDTLKGKTLGIVANYHFGDDIGKYMEDNYNNSQIVSQVTGVDGARQNLKKLMEGRIDMYFDDKYVILYNAQQLGIADQIKIGGTLKEDLDHYIVFSPALPDAKKLAKLYDEGVAKLKNSGEYKKIVAKYIQGQNP